MTGVVYHMCRQDEWDQACEAGRYQGSSQDLADGFIHFSSAAQIRISAARHRAGQHGLVLLEADEEALQESARRNSEKGLIWEESRSGALFPHYYGAFETEAVVRSAPLPLDEQGNHVFPEWFDDEGLDQI
ncbi:DUF952 domain-containing protein [Kiloniella sp. b19]|uniref:DUF952 domain-containing protein n=1 Tax=Kiloniella sp. GXU_MW_B19 TaxID=3141326 RepID=UPI0031E2AE62